MMCGIDPRTLGKAVKRGEIKPGPCGLYSREALNRWLNPKDKR